MSTVDYLILGGGAAGCVLASRLTEQPGVSVTLVEAGKDVAEGDVDPDIRSNYPAKAYFNPDYTWPGQTAILGRARARYEQARLLGGGTSINGLIANRGSPADFDEWEALGAAGWNWAAALPYFRKMERDLDFGGKYHGKDGPFAISRFPESDWTPFVRAVADHLRGRGYPAVADQNGEWRDGVMPVSASINEQRERVTCAIAYLPAAVRARPQLRILTETFVRRILFDGTRAVGAEIERGGEVSRLDAREVIVSCGAIYSPALLMRSGVGPAGSLRDLGFPVVAAREGVGRHLIEHPVASVSCYLHPHARMRMLDRHHTQAHFRYSSNVPGCPPGDMKLAIIARSGWHAVGRRVGSLYLWVNKSYSEGAVTLRSPDPHVLPDVDFRMLTDERDRRRLREGFRLIAAIAASPDLDAVRSAIFPTNYSDRVRKVSRPGWKNEVQMGLFARVLDALPSLRGWLIDRVVTAGITMDRILADDAALDAYLASAVAGVWHPVGTCRMGAPDDPASVTGPTGRVIGVDGLRVVDASVMPSIPCANTQVPTIMLAERMADLIKAERRPPAVAASG